MKSQNYQIKDAAIHEAFLKLKKEHPEKLKKRLNLSWSNWGFGLERLQDSCARLEKADIRFIELHGNHYGPDLGYRPVETKRILADYGIQTGGVCGMFSADNDLSSNRAIHRQAAIDYIRREVDFTAEMGGVYLLVCPAAALSLLKYGLLHMQIEWGPNELAMAKDMVETQEEMFKAAGVEVMFERKTALPPGWRDSLGPVRCKRLPPACTRQNHRLCGSQ